MFYLFIVISITSAKLDLRPINRPSGGITKDYVMIGEPKCGTTWFSVILRNIFQAKPEAITYWDTKSEIMTFSIPVGEGLTSFSGKLTIHNKHTIPYVRGSISNPKSPIKIKCQHGQALASHPPCNLKFRHPIDFNETRKLLDCVADCYVNSSSLRKLQYLQIIRDPRDVAVSQCLYKNKTGLEQSCVAQLYSYVLPWIKYRELLLIKSQGFYQNTVTCYESLVSADDNMRKRAFNDLLRDMQIPNVTDSFVTRLINATSFEHMKHDSGPVLYTGKSKLHSGGVNRYYHYLNDSKFIDWMDVQYEIFEKILESPCAKFRTLKAPLRHNPSS